MFLWATVLHIKVTGALIPPRTRFTFPTISSSMKLSSLFHKPTGPAPSSYVELSTCLIALSLAPLAHDPASSFQPVSLRVEYSLVLDLPCPPPTSLSSPLPLPVVAPPPQYAPSHPMVIHSRDGTRKPKT